MKYNLDQWNYSVYAINYSFVQCVKYRRKALHSQKIMYSLKSKISDISKTFDVKFLNVGCYIKYFHMIFTSKPTLDIPKYIPTVKTIFSRELRRNFHDVKTMLW